MRAKKAKLARAVARLRLQKEDTPTYSYRNYRQINDGDTLVLSPDCLRYYYKLGKQFIKEHQ